MSTVVADDTFQTLVRTLQRMPEPDSPTEWPSPQMDLLFAAGGNRWNVSHKYGGDGVDPLELLEIYRELAIGSLLTTFILTQRNAACQRIETSGNTALIERLLPAMCRGELFATVGISHLTTSRQHLQTPSVAVTPESRGTGFRMNGSVPWATAALQADLIVTGGTLFDGRQVLVAVPTDREGVIVQAPISLMGLSSSQTSMVELHNVSISTDEVLHGPVEKVMTASTGSGAGSPGTSAVAIGAAQGTLLRFADEVERRPELAEFHQALDNEARELAHQLRESAAGRQAGGMYSPESIRQRANSLVLRAAQTWLGSTKGAGYISGHPAERAVRESMFFLVWSCPQLVLEGNLRELSCAASD